MARIRTIKPEFWEDETIGTLSRDARLLFIATFNMADDEGLLRWTVAYIKAQAFLYDEDMGAARVNELMGELVTSGLVYPYRGGKSQQQLGMIVNFHKHQRVNRPQPSKLPAPSLQNSAVRLLYARRDGFVCHLCGYPTLESLVVPDGSPVGDSDLCPSPDHVHPQASGGKDHPSNIRNSHIGCNKARANRPIESFTMPSSVASALGVNHSATHSVNGSVHDSVNGSMPRSAQEGKGRERKGVKTPVATAPDPLFDEFWAAYPRKTDKGNARKAWDKAMKKTSGRVVISAAAAYAATKPDPQFTAHPSTWLNGERWDDQPLTLIQPPAASSPAPRKHIPAEVPEHIDPNDPIAYAAWVKEATQ